MQGREGSDGCPARTVCSEGGAASLAPLPQGCAAPQRTQGTVGAICGFALPSQGCLCEWSPLMKDLGCLTQAIPPPLRLFLCIMTQILLLVLLLFVLPKILQILFLSLLSALLRSLLSIYCKKGQLCCSTQSPRAGQFFMKSFPTFARPCASPTFGRKG